MSKGFVKFASVNSLAVATSNGQSLDKKASFSPTKSAFVDGVKQIDLQEKLSLVADAYKVSSKPGDYIFEAIRGNTSNVRNENKDAFHKNELLRFDHRLGKQVYRTYENKPHHINHRSEDPTAARGFLVDAHYNDSSPALDTCPNPDCLNKTASVEGRDPTGIHCKKCGTVVKDEFVELLVAIDRVKDPTFANGVLSGVLKHGSMGCSCMRTRCNVCNNVAYSRSEFCAHINNKGKEYDESEPTFNPIAYVIRGKTAAKKTAEAFEWCEGVVFDEYSRVHDPADVKAEQYEILQLTAKVAELRQDDKALKNESELLIVQSKLTRLEKIVAEKMAKVAQLQSDVNVNISDDPEQVELQSDQPLDEVPALGTPIDELTPESMGLTPAGPGQQLTPGAAGLAKPPVPPVPPVPQPPMRQGSTNSKTRAGGQSMRFAKSYQSIRAEITKAGNVRIFDDKGTLFAVKPDSIKVASKDGKELAKAVLTMIAESGLGATIKRTSAVVGPRLVEMMKDAQILDYALDDMNGKERIDTGSVLEETTVDMQVERPKAPTSATGEGEQGDRKELHETKDIKNVDILTGRETDAEDEQNDRNPDQLTSTEMSDSDMRDKRKEFKMSDSAIDDIQVDHKGKTADKKKAADEEACSSCDCKPCKCEKTAAVDSKKHAARLEQLFNARLTAKTKELEKKQADFEAAYKERFKRAVKIVAQRQALNLEFSPLKTAMGIVLANSRDLGDGFEFEPMDQHLAVYLTEAAFNDSIIEGTDKPAWEAFIDGLLDRTASILDCSDETLMQIEADLQNMQAAAVPLDVPAPSIDSLPDADHQMRQAAKAGNLQLNPSDQASEQAPSTREQRRSAIRQAMGTTKVANQKANFGR